jgi:xanthine dehydrogenase small subunit
MDQRPGEMIRFLLNDRLVSITAPTGRVMLDVIRRQLGLTGTKEGCREGDCGACTILLGELKDGAMRYRAVDSCLLPLGEVAGKHVVTIEGINGASLNPLQQAFATQGAVQCGFCTPGFIMALTGYLLSAGTWDEDEAITSVAGNICRCTGYIGIRRGISELCRSLQKREDGKHNRINFLIENGYLPDSFKSVPRQLEGMGPNKSGSGDAVVVAGGTDLYVQKPEQLREMNITLLSSRMELQGIQEQDGFCVIGGGVTMEEMRRSPILQRSMPGFRAFMEKVSAQQIRHRATVAGNIVNASPIGDLTIWLLAMEAVLVLFDGEHRRKVPLREFYSGYKVMDRRDDELIEAIRFPFPCDGAHVRFEKVSKRTYLDIASVNSAIKITLLDGMVKEIHLSAGGVAPVPFYLEKTCNFLRGRRLEENSVHEALGVAAGEIKPISDVRGSAEYKRILLQRLLLAHLYSTPGWLGGPGVTETPRGD